MLLAMVAGCSKPDDESDLLMKDSNTIEAMAMEAKDISLSFNSDAKGIEDTCNSKTYALIAGQSINVGTVVVSNDEEFLYVTYNSTGDWSLGKLHLYVLGSEPTEKLTPGQAPYTNESLPAGSKTYTFTIPFGETIECGAQIWLQAHAEVATQTAYGGTIVGSKESDGAWYGNISYLVECCEETNDCDLSASSVVTGVKCFGAATGMIDLTVSGGTAPFTFIWSSGAVTEDLENIQAGEYSVTIYDAHQCHYTLDELLVLQPASGVSATRVVTHISEYGASDGAIDVTVSGGTSPYTFLWNTGAVTEDLSNLGPGTYSVVITDANGCNTGLREILVQEPDEEKPKPVVAFARKTHAPMVHCFLTDPLLAQYEFEQWGWTNGAMFPEETFLSTYELWINVDGCDVSGATKVGEIKLHYFEGTATATFTMMNGYRMNESRLYIGNDILPKVEGAYTVDPADYPYVHSDLGSAMADSYTVNGLNGNIYIIGYVVLDNEEDNNPR